MQPMTYDKRQDNRQQEFIYQWIMHDFRNGYEKLEGTRSMFCYERSTAIAEIAQWNATGARGYNKIVWCYILN